MQISTGCRSGSVGEYRANSDGPVGGAGVGYTILFEGILASVDFVIRRMTVMYYFRVLCSRRLKADKWNDWRIDLDTAPDARSCVLTLLGVGLAATLLAMLAVGSREFRMKTPEGS